MDDPKVVSQRELKRDFHVTRHAAAAIAKAFQLLAAEQCQHGDHESTVQTARNTSVQLQLQEVRR